MSGKENVSLVGKLGRNLVDTVEVAAGCAWMGVVFTSVAGFLYLVAPFYRLAENTPEQNWAPIERRFRKWKKELLGDVQA